MKFIPGSHRQWRYDEHAPMRWNGSARDNSFFGYNYDDIKIDKNWDPDQEDVRHLEMRPGAVHHLHRALHPRLEPQRQQPAADGFRDPGRADPRAGLRRHDRVRRVRSPLRPGPARLRRSSPARTSTATTGCGTRTRGASRSPRSTGRWCDQMRTQYVTTVPFDSVRLAKEIDHSSSFRYSEAYSDYLIGGPWKSCMLWAAGGDSGDGLLTNYSHDRATAFTEYGRQLPYLQELITHTANLARLNFVRLAVFSRSVIVPHRDFLELDEVPDEARSAHRLHIPLATNEECFFSEDNVVYRMRAGEVWYFDASQIHSVASFSSAPRIHLIFDFVEKPDAGPLLSIEEDGTGGIPADRIVSRPPLPDADRADLLRLADVLTMDNFSEVFSILIKKHFRFDGGQDFAWDTMTAIARDCKDPAVLPHTHELRRYYTLERSA